jgi:hypothetical protein
MGATPRSGHNSGRRLPDRAPLGRGGGGAAWIGLFFGYSAQGRPDSPQKSHEKSGKNQRNAIFYWQNMIFAIFLKKA